MGDSGVVPKRVTAVSPQSSDKLRDGQQFNAGSKRVRRLACSTGDLFDSSAGCTSNDLIFMKLIN